MFCFLLFGRVRLSSRRIPLLFLLSERRRRDADSTRDPSKGYPSFLYGHTQKSGFGKKIFYEERAVDQSFWEKRD